MSGDERVLAQLCEVSRRTAWDGFTENIYHCGARRLPDYFEQRLSECEALARELRAYAQDRTLVKNRGVSVKLRARTTASNMSRVDGERG
jgi:hypothetical protein